MKKNTIRAWIVLAIIFVVYLVLALVPPFYKGGVFWLSFVFSLIAILAQGYIFSTAFKANKPVKSKIYGFPIARLGVIYLVVQIIAGFLFMLLGKIAPVWLCAVVEVIILAAAAIGIIITDTVRDEIEKKEETQSADTGMMRGLQARAKLLVELCEDAEVKLVVQKLADQLRYSDPVSRVDLEEAEQKLTNCVNELQIALETGNYTEVKMQCRKAELVLLERNNLCKLNKN